MAKKKPDDGRQPIARNRRAYHDYDILETFEAGIVLTGTEVRSLRDNNCQLTECFVIIRKGEAYVQHRRRYLTVRHHRLHHVGPERKNRQHTVGPEENATEGVNSSAPLVQLSSLIYFAHRYTSRKTSLISPKAVIGYPADSSSTASLTLATAASTLLVFVFQRIASNEASR